MRFTIPLVALAMACLPLVSRGQTDADPRPDAPAPPSAQPRTPNDDESALQQETQQLQRAVEKMREEGGMLQRQSSGQPKKGAWIGVSVSSPPPALRHQLKLPDGVGLVVDFVQPKSPADQAGLKEYDVLQKLDDQLLINPEQFSVLVRIDKPGQEVKLIVLREGKEQVLTAKLAEHELPRVEGMPYWLHNNPITAPVIPLTPNGGYGPVPPSPRVVPLFPEPPEHSITWLDGAHQITITTKDGHSSLLVIDSHGKIVFEGPVDTEKQRSVLPQNLRDALKHLKFFDETPEPRQQKPAEKLPPNGDEPSEDAAPR